MNIDKTLMMPDEIWDQLTSGEVQTRQLRELPQVKRRDSKTKVEYCWTDYTALNESAKSVFKSCLATCATHPHVREIPFTIPDEMSNDDVRIIEDILFASEYKAKKQGKNPWFCCGCFFEKTTLLKNENGKIYELRVNMDLNNRKIIGDMIKSKNGEPVTMFEIVKALVDDFRRGK